ncbi:MAG: hypothetical protein NC180_00330 [Muribaculaceae bacterium]|nr:hypothetical protein [Roseburia sp.]MCM1431668.1 hypothetical protein [Muribaculaceae bacterium]MCM1491660.1 hypothetical protein [Muribaculaceae bacterium]
MKKVWMMAAAALLTLSMGVTAYAETTTTEAGTVSFDGNGLKSSFSSSKLAVSVSEMQPGDSVDFRVRIANNADFVTDWYMSNEVLSSLEDAQSVAENGGYTYRLTYTDQSGTVTPLYDSESVGGEKDSDAGEGLNEVTDSLDEFFYLDRLEAGETGEVQLLIALDGESQGNAYQDTLAQLKMNFAVERASGTPSDRPGSNSSHTPGVKTGDVWTLGAVIALGLGVILMLVGICVYKKREE